MIFTPEQISDARCVTIGKTKVTIGRIRKTINQWQHTLAAWKSSPPRKRGYLYKPDCAGELLADLRYLKAALKDAERQLQ